MVSLTLSDLLQIATTLALSAAVIVSFYFSSRTLREIRNQQRISIFSEYTGRFSYIIRELPYSAFDTKASALKTLSKDERGRTMALVSSYFDLCSEEYYLSKLGKVDSETWSLWERGLVHTVRLPTFRDVWKKIKTEKYDESFIKYMDKVLLTE